jgi:hypothetical protein
MHRAFIQPAIDIWSYTMTNLTLYPAGYPDYFEQ